MPEKLVLVERIMRHTTTTKTHYRNPDRKHAASLASVNNDVGG